ncbi:MAG TPA: DUF983 domain-containing protein [Puia sp.]|uniref:DUF983 domain-containing protein n=1 Tax=Puia sp. TaxID=2045100 RepID=UPI002CA32008|nr:DUF983 domain-containing protein [Puia sp.]HVU99219.1 DUF983 domain-containing protein [Puia sp.]
MCADRSHDHGSAHKPSLIISILRNRCSRCRRGHLFVDGNAYHLKRFMQMNETCPVCGQPFEIEVGFWYGTGFVSYALAVAVSVASFIAWKVLIGMSLHDNRLFWWMGVNGLLLLVLQPPLMRLSRTIWLNFFVWYDRDWAAKAAQSPERTNLALKNDW